MLGLLLTPIEPSVALIPTDISGANTSADRIPELCIFYNSNFIIYSSLWSFYVPCVIMVILYYKIFKAIHDRAKKAIGSRKTYSSSTSETVKSAQVIENVSQIKKFREEIQAQAEAGRANNRLKAKLPLITETDAVTNTGSGGSHDEDDDEEDKDEIEMVECHVIKNKRADQTLDCKPEVRFGGNETKHSKNVVQLQSPIEAEVTVGPNGNTNNTDSGYAASHASHVEDCSQICLRNPAIDPDHSPPVADPTNRSDAAIVLVVQNINKNGNIAQQLSTTSPSVHLAQNHTHHAKHSDSVSHSGSTTGSTGGQTHPQHRPAKKKSRFNLGRKTKSTRKKREKASAKRERKATKTLAIVLGK